MPIHHRSPWNNLLYKKYAQKQLSALEKLEEKSLKDIPNKKQQLKDKENKKKEFEEYKSS
jgi:flagellar motility protein MotE (MotC chaperone)